MPISSPTGRFRIPDFSGLENPVHAPPPTYNPVPDAGSIPAGQFSMNTMDTTPTGRPYARPTSSAPSPGQPGGPLTFNPDGMNNSPFTVDGSRPGLTPPEPQLIGQQQGYTPEQTRDTGGYEARGYNAQGIGVSPNATVSGRLTQLIDENSRYIQQARQRAMQQVNARGMLNSTQAVEAATRAAIDAGLPIAEGDANAYNQRERDLMSQTNAARQFTAGAQNEAAKWQSQLDAETERFNVGSRNEAAKWQSQLDAETERFNTETLNTMATGQWSTLTANAQAEHITRLQSVLGRDQALTLAQIRADTARWASSDSMVGSMLNTVLQGIATAASNTSWSPTQQQGFIDMLLDQARGVVGYFNAIQDWG